MAKLFEDIMNEAIVTGVIPKKTATSIVWLRETASQVSEDKADPSKIIDEESASLKKGTSTGKMYLFNYYAKNHSTLPYYDQFPLIFPFRKVDGGFYGINLHYLPLSYRAKLMDGLYSLSNNTKNPTKLNLSYELLSKASRNDYFKPCVKHYLNSQLRSRFLEIPATYWDIALFLPLQRFTKVTTQKVYSDSLRIIRGR